MPQAFKKRQREAGRTVPEEKTEIKRRGLPRQNGGAEDAEIIGSRKGAKSPRGFAPLRLCVTQVVYSLRPLR